MTESYQLKQNLKEKYKALVFFPDNCKSIILFKMSADSIIKYIINHTMDTGRFLFFNGNIIQVGIHTSILDEATKNYIQEKYKELIEKQVTKKNKTIQNSTETKQYYKKSNHIKWYLELKPEDCNLNKHNCKFDKSWKDRKVDERKQIAIFFLGLIAPRVINRSFPYWNDVINIIVNLDWFYFAMEYVDNKKCSIYKYSPCRAVYMLLTLLSSTITNINTNFYIKIIMKNIYELCYSTNSKKLIPSKDWDKNELKSIQLINHHLPNHEEEFILSLYRCIYPDLYIHLCAQGFKLEVNLCV